MSQTIAKHIGEGFGKGELYAALAYDPNDSFGGMRIKNLCANNLTSDRETLKMHCHQAVDGLEQANEFKGESLSTTGGMTGIVADFILAASGTASITGMMGIAHIGPGVTTTAGYVVGLSGGADVVGTINGSTIGVAGVVGGLMPMIGGVLTECKYFSAIWASSMATQVPSSGESQLLLMTNGLGGTLNQAIYIDGSDRITEFLHIANCSGMTAYNASFTGQSAAEPDASIKVTIDGHTLYIYAYPTVVS